MEKFAYQRQADQARPGASLYGLNDKKKYFYYCCCCWFSFWSACCATIFVR